MAFWAYILRCSDGGYYTGHTDNLEARIGAHQSGLYVGYTRSRRPVTLMWAQEFGTRIEALEAERRIKGWRREKKDALIAGDFALLQRLSRTARERPSTSSGRTAVDGARTTSPTTVRSEPVEGRPSPSAALEETRASTSSARTELFK